MKLYIVHIFPPDTDEENSFFGVFDSEEKYKKALEEAGEEIDFEFEDGTYEVKTTELNYWGF